MVGFVPKEMFFTKGAGKHRELLEHSELYRHLHYLEFNMFAGEI